MQPASPQSSTSSVLIVVTLSMLLGMVLTVFGLAFGFGGPVLGPLVKVILSLFAFLLGLNLLLAGKAAWSKTLGGLTVAGAFAVGVMSVVAEVTGHG